MTDPFVSAHRKNPFEYDLSGSFEPASIRDQMIRGFLLVDRLFDEKDPDLGTRVLHADSRALIIGAGAGGITAAIRAADRGAFVTVVERQALPFGVQRDVSSRWVCPTQYDWPLLHWNEACLPWGDAATMPLEWEAGLASNIATGWNTQLEAARNRHGERLMVLLETEFVKSCESEGAIRAELASCGRNQEKLFDVILDCRGSQGENTVIAGYAGPKFWHHGPAVWKPRGETLIVGGGDGALQDFLLLTTGLKSARDLFLAVFPSGLPADLERRIHCAEDQCHRAWICSGSKRCDHGIFEEVEARHREALTDALLSEPEARARTIEVLAAGNSLVSIIHSCSHFGKAYALNRFLALLIIRVIEEDLGGRARIDGQKVEGIAAIDDSHVCSMNKRCYAFAHEVTMKSFTCLQPGGEISQRQFDRIVIRAGRHGSPPTRQCLPFSVPN